MVKWFKKHFIPHRGNDHKPHFLRVKNIQLIIVIIFILEIGVLILPFIPTFNPANNDYLASVLPAVLDDLTNKNRQEQNLNILRVNPVLNRVAELKAQDMAENQYFSHISPDGKEPWYWFNLVGYEYEYAGENLAVDFTDSQDVVVAWMNSPTHKANILKNLYTEIGTGVATGVFEGKPTIFVAQVFGKPASVEKTVVAVKPVEEVIPEPVVEEAPVSNVMGASIKIANNTSEEVVSEPEPIVDTKPIENFQESTFFQRLVTSPRHIINVVFIAIAILVAMALLFKLVIRMDKKHPVLITNGLVVIILLFGVYVVNNYLVNSKLTTTSSYVSFSEDQFDQNK